MEIRNLADTDFETLFRGFERAFSDYQIHFEKEEVRAMLVRRGYDPKLSFAAFADGEIVSFTLNGIGLFNGIATAYDTGTGTAKEFRGQGLASKIFGYALPYLKGAGVRQYLLEVLQNNSSAIAVYERMNFAISREFDCYRQRVTSVLGRQPSVADCIVEPVGIDFVRDSQAFCDFTPSWQNGMESIKRGESWLLFLGARFRNESVGYCVVDPSSGDLTQIAVRKDYRRMGIGSLLLDEALRLLKTDFIKVINVDAGCLSMKSFLESRNIVLASKQYEMLLPL